MNKGFLLLVILAIVCSCVGANDIDNSPMQNNNTSWIKIDRTFINLDNVFCIYPDNGQIIFDGISNEQVHVSYYAVDTIELNNSLNQYLNIIYDNSKHKRPSPPIPKVQ